MPDNSAKARIFALVCISHSVSAAAMFDVVDKKFSSYRIRHRFWIFSLLALLFNAVCFEHGFAQSTKIEDSPNGWVRSVIELGADPEIIKKHSSQLNDWQTNILKHKKQIESSDISNINKLQLSVDALKTIDVELRSLVRELSPELESARVRLQRLGAPPKDGQPEDEDLASQRALIQDDVVAYDGLVKRAEVLLLQADQIKAVFNSKRRQEFLSQLLRQTENFSDEKFWGQTFTSSVREIVRISDWVATWIAKKWRQSWLSFIAMMAFIGALGYGLFILSYRLFRSVGTRPLSPDYELTRSERGATILRRTLSVLLPTIAVIAILYLISSSFELLTVNELNFFRRLLFLLAVTIFLLTALRYAFIPDDRAEQLVRLHNSSAQWLFRLFSIYICVWFLDHILQLIERSTYASLAFGISRSLLFALIYAALLACLLFVRLIRPDAHSLTRQTYGWPRWIYGIIALLAVVIFSASLLGYTNLAHFLGVQIITTGGLLFFLALVHLTAEFISTPKEIDREEPDQESDSPPPIIGAAQGVVLGIGLDLLVLLIGIPILLLQWGYEWSEVRSWIASAYFGFQIGEVRLSLQSVFFAIGTFIIGLMLTRTVRRMFERRTEYIFADDSGTRESIAKILTYSGFVLSILVALSFIGLGLSNLIVIAGALSIGIGFGLQSIVNNFISGLILLTERPIKKGDWIILGQVEGFVEQIKVRSTEIRTFDRSTVIVPNADLITGQVTNWTYGNRTGRAVINVGVSYDSDPEKVLNLLLDIGKSHPKVISKPEPRCVFADFADSTLVFSLRVYVADVNDAIEVRTGVRKEIWKRFREEGIEIAFPQRDLHIKDVGPLRNIFAESN